MKAIKLRTLLVFVLALAALGFTAPARAVVEIQFWHAMDGALGEKLDLLVERFNASQKKYRVVATYKGSYDDTLALGIAAQLQGKAPHILQVYEVGTASMAAGRNLYKPAHQVLSAAGQRLDAKDFVGPVASFFSDRHGKLLALPFNTSTPVLYYNEDAFKKAGLPRT